MKLVMRMAACFSAQRRADLAQMADVNFCN